MWMSDRYISMHFGPHFARCQTFSRDCRVGFAVQAILFTFLIKTLLCGILQIYDYSTHDICDFSALMMEHVNMDWWCGEVHSRVAIFIFSHPSPHLWMALSNTSPTLQIECHSNLKQSDKGHNGMGEGGVRTLCCSLNLPSYSTHQVQQHPE